MKKLLFLLLLTFSPLYAQTPQIFTTYPAPPLAGLLAARPTFAFKGEYYYATDNSTLYIVTTAPNTWATVVSGGGSSGTVTSVTIAGTSNEITASGTCTITTTGTCTLSIPNPFIAPGSIQSTPPAGDAGYFYLPGNTSEQTAVANTAGFLGPNSASFAGYSLRLPVSAPSGAQVLSFGTPDGSGVSQGSFASAGLPTGLSFSSPQLTISSATNGNGVLGLAGNSSGTATLTAPSAAGTSANPIVASNALQVPAGNSCGGGYGFSTAGAGMGLDGSNNLLICDSNSYGMYFQLTGQGQNNIAITTAGTSVIGLISTGVTFAATGCGTPTSKTGGSTAGSFLAQSTTCDATVTMGSSTTASNGWACSVWDVTTTADTMKQIGSTTTTAVFTGTVISGDKIIFTCTGF